jgi:hypothetical protein
MVARSKAMINRSVRVHQERAKGQIVIEDKHIEIDSCHVDDAQWNIGARGIDQLLARTSQLLVEGLTVRSALSAKHDEQRAPLLGRQLASQLDVSVPGHGRSGGDWEICRPVPGLLWSIQPRPAAAAHLYRDPQPERTYGEESHADLLSQALKLPPSLNSGSKGALAWFGPASSALHTCRAPAWQNVLFHCYRPQRLGRALH